MTELRQVARACCVQGTHCACTFPSTSHRYFPQWVGKRGICRRAAALQYSGGGAATLQFLEAGLQRYSGGARAKAGLELLCSTTGSTRARPAQATSRVLHAVAGSGNETRTQYR